MNIFQKAQKLPEKDKKIILWIVVIIVALFLFVFWAKGFPERIKNFETEEFKKEEMNFPKIEMPKIEIPAIELPEFPELSEEEMQELEEIIKKMEEENSQ